MIINSDPWKIIGTSVQYDVNKLTHQMVRAPRLDTSVAAASQARKRKSGLMPWENQNKSAGRGF